MRARRSGNVRYHTDEVMLRVKYESPEGWLVYSPPLRLKPEAGHANVVWPAGEAGH